MYRKKFSKLLCALLALALLLVQMPGLGVFAEEEIAGNAVLFEDDFESGGSKWVLEGSSNNGTWEILQTDVANSVYSKTNINDGGFLIPATGVGNDWTDYSVEADITFTGTDSANATGNNPPQASISARFTGRQYRFAFVLTLAEDGQPSKMQIRKRDNAETVLAEKLLENDDALALIATYDIKGSIEGNTLNMWLDDKHHLQVVYSGGVAALNAGTICLNNYYVSVNYDNIKVSAIEAPEPSESPSPEPSPVAGPPLWTPTSEQNAVLDGWSSYFGATHSHTDASAAHGNQYSQGEENVGNSAELHLKTARELGFDFYFLADHSQYTNTFTDEKWEYMLDMAEQYTEDGVFVAIRGIEFSENDKPDGHMNVWNTPDKISAADQDVNFTYMYNWLYNQRQIQPAFASFNHPSSTDFNSYGYLTEETDKMVNTIELINGVNPKVTVDGKEKIVGSDFYNSFILALEKGWKVSPIAGFDAHVLQALQKLTYRCGLVAQELTKDALLDAIDNRRTFASYDENLQIKYTVNDQMMGSVLEGNPTEFKFNIMVNDPDTNNPDEVITKIEVYKDNGKLVAYEEFDSHSVHWTPVIECNDNDYFYLRIWTAEKMQYKKDRHTAVVAPVWIERPDKDPLPEGLPDLITDPPKPSPTPEPVVYDGIAQTGNGMPITGCTFGQEQGGNSAANSYDGNVASRWSNGNASNVSTAWIQYDLGETKEIKYINMKLYDSAVRLYPLKIEIGDDPSSLTTVYEGTTERVINFTLFDIPETQGRYVKVTMTDKNSSGNAYLSIHEIEMLNDYTPPAPVTDISLIDIVIAGDAELAGTYEWSVADTVYSAQVPGSVDVVYIKPVVTEDAVCTIWIEGVEVAPAGVAGPLEVVDGMNEFSLVISEEGKRDREYTIVINKETQANVVVDVAEVLAERQRNDVGLCLSWVTDSDKYGRKYSMKEVIENNNFGTIRWPMGTLAMKYIWNSMDDNRNFYYPIKPKFISGLC